MRNETSVPPPDFYMVPSKDYFSSYWKGYDGESNTFTSLNMTLTRYLGANGRVVLRELRDLRCQPAWAFYRVTIEYKNGRRTIQSDTSPGGAIHSDLRGPKKPWSDDVKRSWTEEGIQMLSRLNQYAILDSIVTTIAGNLTQQLGRRPSIGASFSYTSPNGTILNLLPFAMVPLSNAVPDSGSFIRMLVLWNKVHCKQSALLTSR
jgi:hypothetical protein